MYSLFGATEEMLLALSLVSFFLSDRLLTLYPSPQHRSPAPPSTFTADAAIALQSMATKGPKGTISAAVHF